MREHYGDKVFAGLEPHQTFRGRMVEQMPILISGKNKEGYDLDIPRIPASFAYILERRLKAPEDVREVWQTDYFLTGDGSTASTEGDHLIVLNAQCLRELTEESNLYDGALVLPAETWNELKGQKEKVLPLSAEEAQEVQGQGYVKKDGVWIPANGTVAKVWDYLSRGRDLTSYVQLVSESSPRSERLLNVYLNQTTKDGKPTMRPWIIGRSSKWSSNAYADNAFLNFDYDHQLVGIITKEKSFC